MLLITQNGWWDHLFLVPLLGSEARKTLHIFVQNNDCSGRCWIKTFNIVEAPRMDDLIIHSRWSYHLVWNEIHTYLHRLKEFFNRSSVRPLTVSTQSPDDRISSGTLVTTRAREEGGEVPLGFHGNLYYGRSPPIYRLWECEIFTKTLIIMSISTDVHWPYVYDPLGPYISLVNNSIDQITPYSSTLINHPHPHID